MPYNRTFSSGHDVTSGRTRRAVSTTSGNSFLLKDLLPTTMYEIEVYAENEAGRSSPVVMKAFTKPAQDNCKRTVTVNNYGKYLSDREIQTLNAHPQNSPF